MGRLRRLLPTILRGGVGSSSPALQSAMLGLSPLALWPLTETAGTQAEDVSGNDYHATYSNVTLNSTPGPDGVNNAPLWVPASSSYLNLYSAGFEAAASKTEFTVVWWEKMRNAGVWADGQIRHSVNFLADGSNIIRARKLTTVQRFDYTAGGTSDTVDYTGAADTWLLCALTVSAGANQLKSYINNAQNGATQGTLGTWSGSFASTSCVLGASGTAGPGNIWDGYFAYVAYYNAILTLANIQTIYDASNL